MERINDEKTFYQTQAEVATKRRIPDGVYDDETREWIYNINLGLIHFHYFDEKMQEKYPWVSSIYENILDNIGNINKMIVGNEQKQSMKNLIDQFPKIKKNKKKGWLWGGRRRKTRRKKTKKRRKKKTRRKTKKKSRKGRKKKRKTRRRKRRR